MKKRVKLLTTIASLCLAVALMAFGVYAATTATLNVTSSVTFTSNEVYVQIVSNVYSDDDGTVDDGHASKGTDTYLSYNETTFDPNDPGEETSGEWTTDPIALSDTELYVIYTFDITNNGSKAVDATLTLETTLTGVNLQQEATSVLSAEDVAKNGGTAQLKLVLKVKDARQPITDAQELKMNVAVVNA